MENSEELHISPVEDLDFLQDVLAKNIRRLRRQQNLSQSRLAELAELSVNYISHLEQGIKSPSLSTLSKLASALQVKVYQLLLHPGSPVITPEDHEALKALAVEEVMEQLRKQLG